MADRFVPDAALPDDDLTTADLIAEIGEAQAAELARQVECDAELSAAQKAVKVHRLLRRERARRQAQRAVAEWEPPPLELRPPKPRKRRGRQATADPQIGLMDVLEYEDEEAQRLAGL